MNGMSLVQWARGMSEWAQKVEDQIAALTKRVNELVDRANSQQVSLPPGSDFQPEVPREAMRQTQPDPWVQANKDLALRNQVLAEDNVSLNRRVQNQAATIRKQREDLDAAEKLLAEAAAREARRKKRAKAKAKATRRANRRGHPIRPSTN
jgi:hypothetical protein